MMTTHMTTTKTTGSKGSDVYDCTGDPRVDLSVRLVRGADPADLTAIADLDLADAFVLTFHRCAGGPYGIP